MLDTLIYYTPLLNFLVVGLGVPAIKILWSIRANDLKHIEGSQDELKKLVSGLRERVEDHINWHLDQTILTRSKLDTRPSS